MLIPPLPAQTKVSGEVDTLGAEADANITWSVVTQPLKSVTDTE
jgi:hypothetical protein